MKGERVLVTGAGGFVCRHVTAALLAAGYAVIALDRYFDDDLLALWKSKWGAQIKIVPGDVSELAGIQADLLIHGAAVTASPEELSQTPEDNFRANLEPALRAMEWADRQQVRRSVFISSSAVYSESPDGPLSEGFPAVPLGLYAVAKYSIEGMVETLRTQYDRDLVCIRLGNIYGTGEQSRGTRPRTSLVHRMISQALHSSRLVINAQEPARDWTLAEDLGRAVERLLGATRLSHALYHLSSGEAVTPLQIARHLQKHLPNLEIQVIDQSSQPSPRRGVLVSERLRNELGFEDWTPFSQAIPHVIDAMKQAAKVTL